MSSPGIRQTVLDTLAEHYGLAGTLRRLPGENLNFLLRDMRNQKHVIKIVDQDQPPDVVAMEFAVTSSQWRQS